MDSMQSMTSKDAANGATYLSVMEQNLSAVSYTHLDVYKRQAGEVPFFHFDFHNLPAFHQTILDGEFVEPDNPDPVSYTHLDVYKRQDYRWRGG